MNEKIKKTNIEYINHVYALNFQIIKCLLSLRPNGVMKLANVTFLQFQDYNNINKKIGNE